MMTHGWVTETPVTKNLRIDCNDALPRAAIGKLAIAFVLNVNGKCFALKTHCIIRAIGIELQPWFAIFTVVKRRVPNPDWLRF